MRRENKTERIHKMRNEWVDEGANYLYKNITQLQTHHQWTKRKPNQNNGQKINNSQHTVERGSKTRMVHKSAFRDEKTGN